MAAANKIRTTGNYTEHLKFSRNRNLAIPIPIVVFLKTTILAHKYLLDIIFNGRTAHLASENNLARDLLYKKAPFLQDNYRWLLWKIHLLVFSLLNVCNSWICLFYVPWQGVAEILSYTNFVNKFPFNIHQILTQITKCMTCFTSVCIRVWILLHCVKEAKMQVFSDTYFPV